MVMPPVVDAAPKSCVEGWGTVTATVAALHRAGVVTPTVHGRRRTVADSFERDGTRYEFHSSDRALVSAIRAARPDVVHVHGLGWSRLLLALRAVDAPVVAQHHGELPFTGRARWGHRLVRAWVDAYLFTGAAFGQERPWIDAGVISDTAKCLEVLEAASLLPDAPVAAAVTGSPCVLWVGRLIAGKDPLAAIDAFVKADLPHGELHMLATDRALESSVVERIAAAGAVASRIHLHPAVPHDEIGGWYAAADVFLSTSRHEGSSYSLIEAMTLGCVPVVTAIPPHLSIIDEVGRHFPVGDAGAAGAALAVAASMAREPILARGRTALSWGSVAEQLAAAYRSVAR
jgi:glycosyltransferase involved in cell wall biosynthesis